MNDDNDKEGGIQAQNGGFLKSNIFTLTIPQVNKYF